MTDQEFIEQVKGKRIAWKIWNNMYFVPNGKFFNGVFYGDLFVNNKLECRMDWFYIKNRLNDDSWRILREHVSLVYKSNDGTEANY